MSLQSILDTLDALVIILAAPTPAPTISLTLVPTPVHTPAPTISLTLVSTPVPTPVPTPVSTISLTLVPTLVPAPITSKAQALADFVTQYYKLPAPKSADWFLGRKYSFGGSEIPTLFNHNKYKSIRQLLKDKVGIGEHFEGNNFTIWGNLMEPVHSRILQQILCTPINEQLGSIPWYASNCTADSKPIFKYTPDGLCLVNRATYETLVGPTGLTDPDIILLIEQKAVATRTLTNAVPACYIDQPLGGMCAISISETSLFTETVFKRCSQIDWHMESGACTKSFFALENLPCPIQIGAIYMYAAYDTYVTYMDMHYGVGAHTIDMYIDLGACSSDLCFTVANCKQTQHYYAFGANDPDIQASGYLLAIMPWKLYQISFHNIVKQPLYLESYLPVLTIAQTCLKACETCNNNVDKVSHIDTAVVAIKAAILNIALSTH